MAFGVVCSNILMRRFFVCLRRGRRRGNTPDTHPHGGKLPHVVAQRRGNQEAPPPPAPGPARRLRWIELALLIAVAFGGTLYQTLREVVLSELPHRRPDSYDWPLGLVHEATALGLCAYLLYRQGRSFRNLGLTNPRPVDAGQALILFGGQVLLTWVTRRMLQTAGAYTVTGQAAHLARMEALFSARVSVGMLGFMVVNAFYEELIARAYLMTELTALTRSVGCAVVVSSFLQGFYHLYQGWQAAFQAAVVFLFFSLFYARSGRIWPVVLAHLLWDLYWYVAYIFWWTASHR